MISFWLMFDLVYFPFSMTTTGASFLFFNMITCLVGSADLIAPRVFALYPVKAIYYISFFFSFLYFIEVLNTDVLLAYR